MGTLRPLGTLANNETGYSPAAQREWVLAGRSTRLGTRVNNEPGYSPAEQLSRPLAVWADGAECTRPSGRATGLGTHRPHPETGYSRSNETGYSRAQRLKMSRKPRPRCCCCSCCLNRSDYDESMLNGYGSSITATTSRKQQRTAGAILHAYATMAVIVANCRRSTRRCRSRARRRSRRRASEPGRLNRAGEAERNNPRGHSQRQRKKTQERHSAKHG